jgi:hypothetical protein
LIVDERQCNAEFVLQLLHPHRIPHVAADAVEFVAENRSQAFAFGIC